MRNVLHCPARKDPSTSRAGRVNAKAATVAAAQLERALSDLVDVRQALTTSRQQAQAVWEHIQALTEINSRLGQKLTELAREEAQARDFA